LVDFKLTEQSDLVSTAYRDTLVKTHDQRKWGSAGKSHANTIAAWAREIGAKTILDYGCGRATLGPALPEYEVSEYDPGIPSKDALPKAADMVVATDVLEHIEPEFVYNVLCHIRQLAIKGGFLVIALNKSKVDLADGRNSHLTIMPDTWWLEQLRKHEYNVIKSTRQKGLWVWFR
jgi:hypothetical protein